jgi:hypothetical protein
MKLMEICFGDCVPTRGMVRMMQGRSSKKGKGGLILRQWLYKRIVGPAPSLA